MRRILTVLAVCAAVVAQAQEQEDKMEVWREFGQEKPVYAVNDARTPPELQGRWDSDAWAQAETLAITNFFPVGDFRPQTQARMLHGKEGLYLHFRVEDQYVLTTRTKYRGEVWKDACVEFFVQPKPDRGYFNFEINSGGTMLLSYHEHPDYTGNSKDGGVPWVLASQVQIYHSLPRIMHPETAEPVTWHIEYFIPYALLEEYVGPLGALPGQEWRANFYKCAEDNSHPHWGAWAPVLEKYDFHQPRFFGILKFAE